MNIQKTKISILLLVLILSGMTFDGQAFAESAIQCHCFKDRSFNPADTFAADDYILATSFNSLLAKYFAIPKRKIIMVKMSEGVGQSDLVIALKVARITGVDLEKYLDLRKADKTWAEIVSGLSQEKNIQDDLLLKAIRSGMSTDEAGNRIADEIIGDFFAVPAEKITALRKSGLSEKETALVFILVHVGGGSPDAVVEQYRKQGKSWSEIAYGLGVEPAAAGKLFLAYPDKQLPE